MQKPDRWGGCKKLRISEVGGNRIMTATAPYLTVDGFLPGISCATLPNGRVSASAFHGTLPNGRVSADVTLVCTLPYGRVHYFHPPKHATIRS